MGDFEIIHTKRGMKNLVRKIIWMQAYYTTSGIQKQEGRQWVQSGTNKQKIKLASLAHLLEQPASWFQRKSTYVENADGKRKLIPAGTELKREGRVFIMLNKIPELWDRVRLFYRDEVLKHLLSKDRRYKLASKQISDMVGRFVRGLQKDRIYSKQTSSNKPLTIWQKGFDMPLMDSGKMVSSIRNKTVASANGKAQRDEAKAKYLLEIDKYIKLINGK